MSSIVLLEVYQNPHPALSHNKMWERVEKGISHNWWWKERKEILCHHRTQNLSYGSIDTGYLNYTLRHPIVAETFFPLSHNQFVREGKVRVLIRLNDSIRPRVPGLPIKPSAPHPLRRRRASPTRVVTPAWSK